MILYNETQSHRNIPSSNLLTCFGSLSYSSRPGDQSQRRPVSFHPLPSRLTLLPSEHDLDVTSLTRWCVCRCRRQFRGVPFLVDNVLFPAQHKPDLFQTAVGQRVETGDE